MMKSWMISVGILVGLAGCEGMPGHSWQGGWGSGGLKGSGHVTAEQRSVGDFHAVIASGALKVDLTVGPRASFKIEGEDNIIKRIKSDVKGGVLKIYASESINPQKPVRVTLTAPSIDGLEVSGASEMAARGIEAPKLNLDVSGASTLAMAGTAKHIDLECSGASKAMLQGLQKSDLTGEVSGAAQLATTGTLGDVDLEASGASRLDLYAAKAANAKLDLSGASTARVLATGKIDADLSGASNLEYGGTDNVSIDGAEHGSSAEKIE